MMLARYNFVLLWLSLSDLCLPLLGRHLLGKGFQGVVDLPLTCVLHHVGPIQDEVKAISALGDARNLVLPGDDVGWHILCLLDAVLFEIKVEHNLDRWGEV